MQSSRTQAPRWKWKPSSQGLTSLLSRESFSTVRMRPNFAVPLPHSSSTFPSFQPSSLPPPFQRARIFNKFSRKLNSNRDSIFKIRQFTFPSPPFSLPSLNIIIVLTSRLLFTPVLCLLLFFFLPLFRCRHKILEASNWILPSPPSLFCGNPSYLEELLHSSRDIVTLPPAESWEDTCCINGSTCLRYRLITQ